MTILSLARVQSLVDLGRYADARAELGRYLAAAPESVTGLCLLAACELELKNLPAALDAAGRALAIHPESDWALRLRALALSKQDEHMAAVKAAEAAVRTGPDFWANHYVLGQVLLGRRRERERAHEVAKRAVELAPHESDPHVLLGLTASRLGLEVTERRAYEEALRLDPDNAMALNNLAVTNLNSAHLGDAARIVVAGLRLAPGDETLRRNLDAVALRLMDRLITAMLLSAMLLVIVRIAGGNEWWARATVGALLLCCYALMVWATLRHLPGGARRYLRGLPRRMTLSQRLLGIALVAFTLPLLAVAFTPGQPSHTGAWVMALIVRIFQVLFVVWLIWLIIRMVARRSRAGRGTQVE